VVNRLPHSGQERRRRMSWPSSASRESTTRESACRQYGHRIAHLLKMINCEHTGHPRARLTATVPSSDDAAVIDVTGVRSVVRPNL
jgi:hypothetical protein